MLKYFGKFWKFLTIVRSGLANFVFLLFIVFIIAIMFAPGREPMPDQAPLFISMSGVLVDQLTYQPSIFDLFDEEKDDPETLVRDVTVAINHAAGDKRITALILNLNRLSGGSFSKLEEIGQAIENFKASGKPVIAFADSFSQAQYFLASHADDIYLNTMGNLALTGFGYYGSYFKEATDKLSVKFHLFKVGDYKDAAEPFVRNSMSDASREHNSSWVSELWGRYTSKVEAQRELPSGAIEAFIVGLPDTLKSTENNFSSLAKNAGLVDATLSRVELNELLIEKFGKQKNGDFFKAISFKRYLSEVKPRFKKTDNNIGLIIASGTIIDGDASGGQIGGNSLSGLIREALEDESLKALIIRIDSGGGSAFASEIIRDELANAKTQGLPVYVSMGSVAASGGYWIATAADEIWALPSTITGSIGVWGLVPNLTESFKRLGIHNDGFGTTPLSDIYQIARPLSPQAQQIFQSGVDNVYQQFITIVADARDKSPDDIHQIGQGRVWTGEKALEFGLVDQLGTLDDLIQSLGQKLNLDTYQVKLIEPPMSATEQFLRVLMEETELLGDRFRTALVGEDIARFIGQTKMHEVYRSLNIGEVESPYIYTQCLKCLAP